MQRTESARTGSGKGYGGKWLKWAAIYLVAGAIIYAIVYFVFFDNGGGYSGGGSGSNGGGGGTGGYGLVPLPLVGLRYAMWRLKQR